MAQRRMFSPDIVKSDAFLDMPISTQALYFHLGMNADDDGFVSPRRVIREIGVADDDLKILIGKRFVLPFENGVVVIKHWKINNLVRKDWYKETQYVEQKSQLKTKENGAYSELVNEMLTKPKRIVDVGKVRLGKVRKEIPSTIVEEQGSKEVFGNEDIKWVLDTFKELMEFDSGGKKQQDRFMAKHLLNNYNREQIRGMMRYCATNEFAPRIGSVEKLWYKRGDIIAGILSLKNKTNGTIQSL